LLVNKNKIKLSLVILVCLILQSVCGALAAEKPHIGVLRFTNNTQAYWWFAGAATELQDTLANELAATKSFHVLDRQELYSLLEHKFTENVLLDTKQKPKPVKIRGVRYLIMATVSAFEENTNGGSNEINFISRFFGHEQKRAYVVIDVKVIDSDTGIVADSRSIEAAAAYGDAVKAGHSGNPAVLGSNLSKLDKTSVGKAIRNDIIKITEYLECLLITKDEECLKKYAAPGTKRKEKNKAAIQHE
jgi:curli biogenesis system outer membrane secretion channel CsgG